jgi:hypothetical protein
MKHERQLNTSVEVTGNKVGGFTAAVAPAPHTSRWLSKNEQITFRHFRKIE